eukprot:1161106-Pelagomonas_calceolata.AAC.10
MKTERHDIAERMITKALSKSPWGAGLVNKDIGGDDRLAQHNLQTPAHAPNRVIPSYLFPRSFPKRSRLTSSCPDAILVNLDHAKNTSSSPPSSRSHHVLRSRHGTSNRTSAATRDRHPHQPSATSARALDQKLNFVKIQSNSWRRHGGSMQTFARISAKKLTYHPLRRKSSGCWHAIERKSTSIPAREECSLHGRADQETAEAKHKHPRLPKGKRENSREETGKEHRLARETTHGARGTRQVCNCKRVGCQPERHRARAKTEHA